MRFALFCDGAYSPTVVAIVVAHALATIVKVEDVRVVAVVVVVRRRTPIVAVVTIIDERCPVTGARSRKEDMVAVRSRYLVTILAVLCSPCPITVIYQFLLFFFRRHSPTATPISSRCIVRWSKIATSVYIALRL